MNKYPKIVFKTIFFVCVIFVLSILFSSTALATNYYVSSTGSGTTCSQSAPCSLSTGIAKPNARDTVLFAAGTYTQAVPDITKSGIEGSPITYQAQGKATIKGVYIPGSYINFRGFTVSDPTSDWGIRTSGNYNLVENNEITNTMQDGIWFFGSYNTFRGNYIHDIVLPDNDLNQTHCDCFQTWDWDWDVTHVLFENNTCVNNRTKDPHNSIAQIGPEGQAPPRDSVIGYITFRNNIFVIYSPMWAAFSIEIDGDFTIENNTVVNMGLNGQDNVVTYIAANMSNVSIINNLFINWGGREHIPTLHTS